ncbi:MAG: hypothetical protein WC247_11550 [Porticoccaceae bacterium]
MTEPGIAVPASYRREWLDGYGARGWKLDVSNCEPSVIAATAAHGIRIPTSVLVHDILDHHLCGFGIGGHRNEAMALLQLASRTGTDPRPDFRQIIDEDLMHGHCNGESLRSFLPDELVASIPVAADDDGKSLIDVLRVRLGDEALRALLVDHFMAIGRSAQAMVEARWRRLGLDYRRRDALGLALQRLVVRIDTRVCEADWEQAHGRFIIGNRRCTVVMDAPRPARFTATVG